MKKLIIIILVLLAVNIKAQWEKLPTPSLQSSTSVSPYVKGIKDSIIFISGEGLGLYRSTNLGNTWESAKTVFNRNGEVGTIFTFDSLLIAYGYNDSANSLVAISKDNGENWTKLINSDLKYCNTILQSQNDNAKKYIALYFDLSYGFISNDNGETWNRFESNIRTLFPYSLSNSSTISVGKTIYASVMYYTNNDTKNAFCVSDDNGITWSVRNNGLPVDDYRLWLGNIVVANNTLVLKSYLGAFISTDFGKQWTKIALPNLQDTYRVEFIKSDDEIIYMIVSTNSISKNYKSIDAGKNWSEISEFPYYYISKKIYCEQKDYKTFLISTDKGMSWQSKETVFFRTTQNTINYLTSNGKNLFLGAGILKYMSNSNQINWNSFTVDRNNVSSLLTPGTHKFKFGWDSYATFDNGFTWVNLTIPRTSSIGVHGATGTTVYDFDEYLSQIIMARSDGIVKYNGAVFSDGILHNIPAQSITTGDQYMFVSAKDGIYRSKDCCQTIEKVLSLDYYIKLVAYNNTVIGCYLPNGAIWVSFDNGNTWKQKFLGITNIVSLAVDDKYLFFVTKDELWKAPLENLLTDVEEHNIPTSFSLSQNYPNPFNPETTINYQLPTPGFVTLKVYDLLGQEVIALVNEYKQPGNYKATFNVDHLERSREMASGIYFYCLQAGSYIETKKLVLLK